MNEDIIVVGFEKNMMNLPARDEIVMVKPSVSEFNGVEFAKMLGMPKRLLEDLESTDEDVYIDYHDNYGFFGLELNIYTKKHIIRFVIPFNKKVIIDCSKVPETVKNHVEKILKRILAEAQIWTEIPYSVRQHIARQVLYNAYNSLKKLKED